MTIYRQEFPRQGEGWDTPEHLFSGLPVHDGAAAADRYGFRDAQEFYNYLLNELVYNPDDRRNLEEVTSEINWDKCGQCESEIQAYMMEGAERGEIDINPRYSINHGVDEEDAEYRQDADVKKTAWLTVWCDRHDEEWFSYEESWYAEEK